MSRNRMEVYRLRGKLAINPPEGPTFYISYDAAVALAKALDRGIQDLETKAFVDSEFPTHAIEIQS